jgi:hypothetical protein
LPYPITVMKTLPARRGNGQSLERFNHSSSDN